MISSFLQTSFYESVFAYPLSDETSALTTGVKYVTEPAPYNFTITDIICGLTTAGTGATLFKFNILLEDTAPNTITSSQLLILIFHESALVAVEPNGFAPAP